MIRAVIIDDEAPGSDYLNTLLTEFCPQVAVEAIADSIESGIKMITEHRPELVFLDIKLPGGTGFDILKAVSAIDFDVIFTTAHDNFAIKAFRFSALDYLLKPIDAEDLLAAIEKLEQKKRPLEEQKRRFQFFMDQWMSQDQFQRITLPVADGFTICEIPEIIRCESDGSYTRIFFKNDPTLLISRVLKEMEDLLEGSQFFRIHRSHLVNLREVIRYKKSDGGLVVMSDGEEILISRRKKDEFLHRFNVGR